jgi:hypothetical protein
MVLIVPRQCIDERIKEIIAAFRLAFKYIDSLMIMNTDACNRTISP